MTTREKSLLRCRAYAITKRGKAARTRYRLSPKGQAAEQRASAKARIKFLASPEGQAVTQRRLLRGPALTKQERSARKNASPAGRASAARYHASQKFKLVMRRYYFRVVKPRRERERANAA